MAESIGNSNKLEFSIISHAFRMLGQHPRELIGAALVIYLPSLVLSAIFGGETTIDPETGAAATRASSGIIGILDFLLGMLVVATMSYAAIMTSQAKPISIRGAISQGMTMLLPVLGLSLFVGIMALFGFLALIVPGIIIVTMYYVSIPALVFERNGIGAAMRRSRELTKGHRWQVVGLAGVASVVMFVTIIAFSLVFGMIAVAIGGSFGNLLATLLGYAVGAIAAAFNALVVAGAFFELRRIKEGTSLKDLAAVFD